MATVSIVPGNTAIQLAAQGRVNKTPPVLRDVPGGLYPLKSAAFEVDEYRIMSGWPVPVPDCDISIQCLVSAEGDVLTDRDAPTALTTAADMRWVADSSYYDQVTCQWTPIQGHVTPWESTPDHLPSLVTDYEYTVGDERFTDMTVLNFDSDTGDYMWNDLTASIGGVFGYTVIMVLNPNSVYGNNTDVIENGLWGPQDTDGAWVAFTIRDQAVFVTTESIPGQQGVALGNALAANRPTFLALVVGRPHTRLYAASGPSKVLSKGLASGATPEPLSTRFWLGNTPSVTAATTDMALLDLGIYGNPLTKAEVINEIAALATVYGGDS